MRDELQDRTIGLLRLALNDPTAKFREGQWEAIASLVELRDRLLVVQRTGWGKSIVYFLATRLLRDRGFGPTLLISPLLALMRNQIAAATRLNLEAATINSSNYQDWEQVKTQLLAGKIDLLLISPERLANENFRANILLPISANIGLFVVDEAHCISDWGHDFRPDYQRITRILQALPSNLPAIATTATANNRVVDDITAQLGSNLRVFRGNLTRQSLQLQNIYLPSPAARMAWLAEQLPNLPGSGIIYTLTVRDSERVAAWLQSQKINAKPYHSQLENEERETLEDELIANQVKALVATTALGMGFDKPDLGFVIHYQRPGSVVHYYQQVGRAGRAVEQAYGILLSGDEDDEITDYFIETAFPPQAHTEKVLNALNKASDGFSVPQLEEELNLTRGQIEKVLKLLSLASPAPVTKINSQWYRTPVDYQPDLEKIEKLTRIRQQEQAQMQDYLESQECLMKFLAEALDDSQPNNCGKCAICLGENLLPTNYSSAKVNQAIQFLRRSDQIIEPRKRWVKNALPTYGFSGNIKDNLQAEIGRGLCLWGDAGWGELVKKGKYQDNYFDDALIPGIIEMIQRWQPEPMPTWITCVPSLNRPELVPNFSQRLATQLNLPFIPVVEKIRQNSLQKTMSNSYHQAHNLDGVFAIERSKIKPGAVFLIDDFVDSRWTFTVVAALLRQAGSGQVFPLALAINSLT
ncbi:MAG: RecQ family ATP-dependent DNA helicase [Oscillatoria sp. PMC 1068.18]|nr:RecQ family ATP-dependent DNA helicase [Oscillatoria sp. PMC 1076.18]MEC4988804.1 RecQ family ATP-dependent DNA helicase [Oscillatoria sp. PMC 1068.18]